MKDMAKLIVQDIMNELNNRSLGIDIVQNRLDQNGETDNT